jgi:hypothetical protein
VGGRRRRRRRPAPLGGRLPGAAGVLRADLGEQGAGLRDRGLDLGLAGLQAGDLGALLGLGGGQGLAARLEGLGGDLELVHHVAVVLRQQVEHLDAVHRLGGVVAQHRRQAGGRPLDVGDRDPVGHHRAERGERPLGVGGLAAQVGQAAAGPVKGQLALVVLLDELVGLAVQGVQAVGQAGGAGRAGRRGAGRRQRERHQERRQEPRLRGTDEPSTVGGPSGAERQGPQPPSSRLETGRGRLKGEAPRPSVGGRRGTPSGVTACGPAGHECCPVVTNP